MVGTSQTNISRWERDGADDLKATHLRGLLKALNVSEAYLRGESDDSTQHAPNRREESAGVPGKISADFMNQIQKSLAKAFDHDKHTLQDLDDVRAVLRETPYFPEGMDTDRAAVVWLDASAHLRAVGQPVTAASLAVAMMALPAAHALHLSAPSNASPSSEAKSTGIRAARQR